MKVGILIISDRSARGEREDACGPLLVERVKQKNWDVGKYVIIPDEVEMIVSTLIDWSDIEGFDVILTSGGTGFSPRDVTPEATQAVIERAAPGIAEAIRAESLKITPHAMLSRAIAGIRKRTLIINLPGSPKAAVEGFEVIQSALPHAVDLLHESKNAEKGHQFLKEA
ncbi:MAG: MogA/MoaB family molybdenum cofactor biosynthesis protein [Anaerolineales bacterium]